MIRRNKKINRKKHEVSSNTIAIISSIVILLGGFIFSYNYTKSKKILAYEYMNNIFAEESTKKKKIEAKENEEPKIEEEINGEEENKKATYDYIGYLEIPKIKLKKGFVSKKSRDNNVEKNIFIVDQADYPDKKNGNFIIAAHSGTGWKAFFNDLYQLEKNNDIYVTYKNKKYLYKIADIYTQKKTGTIAIYRDYNKKTLTLVTCTNNDDTTQTVYIAYLEQTENL